MECLHVAGDAESTAKKDLARRQRFGARFPNFKTASAYATHSRFPPTPDTGLCAPKWTTRARTVTMIRKMWQAPAWRVDRGQCKVFPVNIRKLYAISDTKITAHETGPHRLRFIATTCAIVCNNDSGSRPRHRQHRHRISAPVFCSRTMTTIHRCSICCRWG